MSATDKMGSVKSKVKLKLSLCLTKHSTVNPYWSGGMAPQILEVSGGEWSASRPGLLPRGKSLRYPLDRSWAGPRAGMDAVARKNSLPFPGIVPRSSSPQCNLMLLSSAVFFFVVEFGFVRIFSCLCGSCVERRFEVLVIEGINDHMYHCALHVYNFMLP
jgi:hypothetical protein